MKIARELWVVEVREGRGRWRELERHCHPKIARQACNALFKRDLDEINKRITVTHINTNAGSEV
jgi:hypothetical protein